MSSSSSSPMFQPVFQLIDPALLDLQIKNNQPLPWRVFFAHVCTKYKTYKDFLLPSKCGADMGEAENKESVIITQYVYYQYVHPSSSYTNNFDMTEFSARGPYRGFDRYSFKDGTCKTSKLGYRENFTMDICHYVMNKLPLLHMHYYSMMLMVIKAVLGILVQLYHQLQQLLVKGETIDNPYIQTLPNYVRLFKIYGISMLKRIDSLAFKSLYMYRRRGHADILDLGTFELYASFLVYPFSSPTLDKEPLAMDCEYDTEGGYIRYALDHQLYIYFINSATCNAIRKHVKSIFCTYARAYLGFDVNPLTMPDVQAPGVLNRLYCVNSEDIKLKGCGLDGLCLLPEFNKVHALERASREIEVKEEATGNGMSSSSSSSSSSTSQ